MTSRSTFDPDVADCVTLGEFIAALEALPRDATIEHGLEQPHSYRGYYKDLGFERAGRLPVIHQLAIVRACRGTTFEGYKGGDYVASADTRCWIAQYGSVGVPLTSGDLAKMAGEAMLSVMATTTPEPPAAESDRVRGLAAEVERLTRMLNHTVEALSAELAAKYGATGFTVSPERVGR